jgi:hypothetical protein
MAGADLFSEKSNAGGWFVLREKYYWLVADKPNERGLPRRPAASSS